MAEYPERDLDVMLDAEVDKAMDDLIAAQNEAILAWAREANCTVEQLAELFEIKSDIDFETTDDPQNVTIRIVNTMRLVPRHA